MTSHARPIEMMQGDGPEDVEGATPAAPESDATEIVTLHPRVDRSEHLRIVEAILFAATEPVSEDKLQDFLPAGTDVGALLADLAANYENRGVNLVKVAGKWMLKTAADLHFVLRRESVEQKKLSKAALETLAIISYHQPVTRAEIEEIRGVAISKGTLDHLLEIGWIRMRGRRKTPGRPVTYGTTAAFLEHFGLNEVSDLPGLAELKAAGLLDANVPPGFDVPVPRITDDLTPDEEPLDGTEVEMPLDMHLPDPQADPQAEQGETSPVAAADEHEPIDPAPIDEAPAEEAPLGSADGLPPDEKSGD
jgi:segregation and condensation protein B